MNRETALNKSRSRLEQGKRQSDRRAARAVDAATLMILRQESSGISVLMGKRNAGHKFMPNVYVFPGGRVDKGDWQVPVAHDFDLKTHQLLQSAVPSHVGAARRRAIGVAALRETCEETGFIIGARDRDPQRGNAKRNIQEFAHRALLPDLAPLKFVGRAVTPPFSPRRFDTRFFCMFDQFVSARCEDIAREGQELEDVKFFPLAETRNIALASITAQMICELEVQLSEDPQLNSVKALPFFYWRAGSMRRAIIQTADGVKAAERSASWIGTGK